MEVHEMVAYEARRRVGRPPDAAFDVIGTHVYENHPSWESEVVEIRPLTEPPVRVGSRAIMVRREYGRRTEVPYEVTEFEQDRKIAFRHISGQMDFDIAFFLAPAADGNSDLVVKIRATPKGVFRLLTPIVARNLPKTSERITSQMVALVESRP
jgi:hypothetical protein